MMPTPAGGWVMMCPCGVTEVRSLGREDWREFRMQDLPDNRYQLVCLQCERATSQQFLKS